MTSYQSQTVTRSSSLRDWGAVLILISLAVWLFRQHFFGDYLWMGNPDRLNSDLKVLKHFLSELSDFNFSAWNEHEMMGYDSFALHYTFPNPLVFLVALFGADSIYISMGYIEITMLAMAGISAYAFIRADLPAGIPVLVGAICYEFSSLTLLKVSQNSMSFAVFIMIPMLALAARYVRRDTAPFCFLVLAFLLTCMLNLMFLQKAAYALMLVGTYALWRSWSERSCLPLLTFGFALGVAVAFAFPRIFGIAIALGEYKRAILGVDLNNFDVLYEFQNIRPYEFFRWFDDSIFGRSLIDAHEMKNNINLTEGFLLYTSAITPLVLLTGLVRSRFAWLNIYRSSQGETSFFFWSLIFCILVVVFKPLDHFIYLLFFRLDFTHARILIAALLPLSVLVSLTLYDLSPQFEPGLTALRQTALGLAAGLLAAFAIEIVAVHIETTISVADLTKAQFQVLYIRKEAIIRVALSILIFLLMLRASLAWNVRWRRIAHIAICALLAGQCLLAADKQISGPQTFNFRHPFNWGDFYYAQRDEFRPPSAEQLHTLHQRIQPDRYRVALICDHDIADGFCAGHVPEFWQLRAIDGYYGLGVPRRLRALPWPTGVSLRTISFTSLDALPWDLLGFLNVRWVLKSSDGVYRNIVREGDRITGLPDSASFELISSPSRVTPRAFFAAAVEPVASPEDAASRLFRPEGIVDPEKTSFVEDFIGARRFDADGAITISGHEDLLDLKFDTSPTERFIVLNDLYYPGWHADIDGLELPILATNAVMRGVALPPGADHLRFRYVSYSSTLSAWMFRLAAVLATLALFVGLRRMHKS